MRTLAYDIAGVLDEHLICAYDPEQFCCSCDTEWRDHEDHHQHVAEAIVTALELERTP